MTRLVVGVLALAVAAVLTGCGSRPASQGSTDTRLGLTVFWPAHRQPMPPLAGTTLTGRHLSATSYAAGTPLVVNVWASWCSPCRRELPLLARAARHGVRVLGIDERDGAGQARSFARSQGATYPSLVDPDGRLLAALRLLPQAGIPSTLVVTPRGRVAARVVGPLTSSALRRALATAAS